MEQLHDSLSQELGTAPRAGRIPVDHSNADNSYSKIRPITTGIIDVKYSSSHFRNHTDQFVDSTSATAAGANGQSRIRPRAPIVGRRKGRHAAKDSSHADSVQPSKRNPSNKIKSNNIAEKWDSLQRFSQNNQGRSLADPDVSSLNNSAGGGIHFVNVNNFSSSDRRPNANHTTSATANKSATNVDVDHDISQHYDYESSSSRKNRTKSSSLKTSANDDRIFSKVREPIETSSGKLKSTASTAFTIPELPAGKQLIINILSTWGDPHYVGMMGIDIFDKGGHLVKLSNTENQIWANPADINVLPEYDNDPRTVDNLLDGVNHTCDDLHAWLAPFTGGQNHFIHVEFDEPTVISMIRIWNYNKNRIHSYRGARYIEMSFDSVSNLIFRGEIKRALGAVMEPEACSECVLFTMNESILNLIEKYDPIAIAEREHETKQSLLGSFLVKDVGKADVKGSQSGYRDRTSSECLSVHDGQADERTSRQVTFSSHSRYHRGASLSPTRGGDDDGQPRHLSRLAANVGGWEGNSERPLTGKKKTDENQTPSATTRQFDMIRKQDSFSKASSVNMRSKRQSEDNCPLSMSYDGIPDHMLTANRQGPWNPMSGLTASASTSRMTPFVRPSTAAASRHHQALEVSTIEITLCSNWGDSEGIGLTGISALDDNFDAVALPSPTVVFKDKHGLVTDVENCFMSCSPDVLIDNNNLTTDSAHMWYCVYSPDRVVSLRFDMSATSHLLLRGLNIWNYNGTSEEAFKGAKHVEVCVNSSKVIPAVLRKALGDENSSFEYAQFLHLTGPEKSRDFRRHNSIQQLATLVDSSPDREKNKRRVLTSELRSNSMASDNSSPCSAIISESSAMDDSSLLDGRFSPIQARSKFPSVGGFEDSPEGQSLVAPSAEFEFRPTNCITAQQYETPVSIVCLQFIGIDLAHGFNVLCSVAFSLRMHAEDCDFVLSWGSLLCWVEWD